MGWGWPFSPAASASARGSETPAVPAPPPQGTDHDRRVSQAQLQQNQLELMRLEKENLERIIKIRQLEEASRAPRASTTPSVTRQPLAQQAAPPPPPELPRTREETFRRSAKQLGLFFAGAGFLTLSALIARRAVARKMVDATPKLFHPSHHGPRPPPRTAVEKGEDQLVAVEALGLATLNVFSFGVMMTGGLMFAFDISNVEDLRRKARSKLYGTNGVVDEAAEQQVEEWIADVLSRRDKKEDDAGSPTKNG